jgi:predicted DNA-binding protein
MNVAVKPTSIRLSSGTQMLLDNAAKQLRRSKSYLVEEALKAQLTSVIRKESELAIKERLERLMALKGAGAREGGVTADEIDARQRAFRGED